MMRETIKGDRLLDRAEKDYILDFIEREKAALHL